MQTIPLWYYVANFGPRVLCAVIAFVVLWLLARRAHSGAMWWLLVAVGVWPLLSAVYGLWLSYTMMNFRGPGMSSWVAVWSGAAALAFPVVTCVLSIVAAVKLARELTLRPPGAEPLCPCCGYNLRGLDTNRCPECGTPFLCETRYLVRTAGPSAAPPTA